MSRNWVARICAKLATASVIIEKKIARTRRLSSPMPPATTTASAVPPSVPTRMASHPTQPLASGIATP